MARFGSAGSALQCSFCGKAQHEVIKIIAGPGVYICDQCVDLCGDIIEEEVGERPGRAGPEVTDPD